MTRPPLAQFPTGQAISGLGYRPALDGLRAVAVLLVVGYHARLPGFQHGDLGVDVFFVLSGFLITSLIISELMSTGSFGFKKFYVRRFVRLFPAYFLVLLTCLAATAVRGYGGTARGAVLSFLYVANWGSAQGQGLGLLRHTWSLSIEEQFYIAWPITVLLLIGLVRARVSALAGSIVALMGASYGLALLMLHTGTSLTWVSNATPTRAGMLLAGALLAAVLGPGDRAAYSPQWLRLLGVAGVIGFVALLGLAMLPSSPYRSGWGLVSVLWPSVAAATVLIVAVAVLVPNGSLGRLLASGPLIALGKRSYGLYLWHFPIFTILDTEFHGLGAGQIIGGAALALLLAALSYRFVEQPLIATLRGRQQARLAPAHRAGPSATRAVPMEQT